MAETGALLIFTRAPVPGETKTRLIPELGKSGAASLHTCLLESTLRQASHTCFETIQLWCTTCDNDQLQGFSETYRLPLKTQWGQDLGERMYNALTDALAHHDYAVIIGSDCPGLTTCILNTSADTLRQGKDAVIGPSADGGYYLVGMRQPAPTLFTDIPWGDSSVAKLTRERLVTLGWQWAETMQLRDIDTPADLKNLEQAINLVCN